MLIVLSGERCQSLNKMYAGRHWSRRAEEATRVHELVYYTALEQQLNIAPFNKPVRITIRAYFKNRPMDPDNIVGKLYVDALRHVGIIHDDTIKYVASVTTESHVDNKNPRVEIEVVEE